MITLVCVLLFGGVIMNGSISLIGPISFEPWTYIVLKTLYTGVSAALATGLAVFSVLADENRSA